MVQTALPKRRRNQLPLKLPKVRKTTARTQFAALCYRKRKSELQICIITSRTSKRWILPKGWPMHNQTPAEAAATEAWEEAGLTGKAYDVCLGVYSYTKQRKKGDLPVLALVYPVKVRNVHSTWPEAHQRKRKWVTPAEAAKRLQEPALKRIVANFTPALVKR